MIEEKTLEAVELNEQMDIALPLTFTRISSPLDPFLSDAVRVYFNFGSLMPYAADELPREIKRKIVLRARLLVQQHLGWNFPETGGFVEPGAVLVTRHTHQLNLGGDFVQASA